MQVKLGHEYVATKRRSVAVGFHCQSLLFLDETGARDRARRQADQDVRDEAAKIIALAPCPACGKRKAHEVAALKLEVAFPLGVPDPAGDVVRRRSFVPQEMSGALRDARYRPQLPFGHGDERRAHWPAMDPEGLTSCSSPPLRASARA